MPAVKITVHGVVQGVGYRALVMEIATQLGIIGYAKNMPDGSVEILAIGQKDRIDEFRKLINVDAKHGPQVHKIDAAAAEETESYNSFEIR
jgi:acylphosphatase